MCVCVCDACVMKAVRSMRAALCLLALAPRNSHRLLPSNGKRCAVSDGGEETKEHEEVTRSWGIEEGEESSTSVLRKSRVSRERLFLFSATNGKTG